MNIPKAGQKQVMTDFYDFEFTWIIDENENLVVNFFAKSEASCCTYRSGPFKKKRLRVFAQ